MAVIISKSNANQTLELCCQWVLAENLNVALKGKVDPQEIWVAKHHGHHYLSSREVLSLIEKHFT